MTIVADSGKNNIATINYVKSWLNSKHMLLHRGDFCHTRCTANIINLIVKNVLKVTGHVFVSIRKSCLLRFVFLLSYLTVDLFVETDPLLLLRMPLKVVVR